MNILQALPLSHLVATDKVISLYRSVECRRRHFVFQLAARRPAALPPSVAAAARADLAALEQILRRLVVNSFVSNARYLALRRRFRRYGTAADHLDRVFGHLRVRRVPQNQDPVLAAVLKNCKVEALDARRAELITRLKWEMSRRVGQGWYVVFNTLTVRPGYEQDVFSTGSRIFSDYVRRVDRAVAASVFGAYRARDGSDYHSYFAVVEEGETTGRLHLHVLHFCRALPAGCCDPNLGLAVPVRREITRFKEFWQYGISAPIAARFGVSDAYGLDGWRYVMVEDNGRYVPAAVGSCDRLAGYVGKYICKAYNRRGDYKWRTRMTRGLGTQCLRKALSLMTNRQLMQLTLQPVSPQIHQVETVALPQNLLRREATRRLLILFKRSRKRRSMKFLRTLQPRETIVERLLAMSKPTITRKTFPPCRSTGVISTRRLRSMAICDFTRVLACVVADDHATSGARFSAGGSVRSVDA